MVLLHDNPAVHAIWSRLMTWNIDVSGVAVPFSWQLGAENGWHADHTQRVIQEYKRFALLAVTTSELMTPSDAVDQVWHLHLAYTRSYWEDFCPNVLQAPLHHEPSRGGVQEARRYWSTYEATMQRYREVFGEVPPADIWPAPAIRFAGRFQRVDLAGQQRARWPGWSAWRPGKSSASGLLALTALAGAGKWTWGKAPTRS